MGRRFSPRHHDARARFFERAYQVRNIERRATMNHYTSGTLLNSPDKEVFDVKKKKKSSLPKFARRWIVRQGSRGLDQHRHLATNSLMWNEQAHVRPINWWVLFIENIGSQICGNNQWSLALLTVARLGSGPLIVGR